MDDDNDNQHDPNDPTIPEAAVCLKQEAAQKVALQDWASAAKLYQKSGRALSPLSSLTWPQHEEFALALHSNMAHCYLKLNKPKKALDQATFAQQLPIFENVQQVSEGLRQKVLARRAESMVIILTMEQENNNNNAANGPSAQSNPYEISPQTVWAILENAQQRGYLSSKGGTAAPRDLQRKFFALGGECQALIIAKTKNGASSATVDKAEKSLNAWTDQLMRINVIPLVKAMQARKQYQTRLTAAPSANEQQKLDLALAALQAVLPQSTPQFPMQQVCQQLVNLVRMGRTEEGLTVVRNMLLADKGLYPTQSAEDKTGNLMWAICFGLLLSEDRGPRPTRTFRSILSVLVEQYGIPVDQRGQDARNPLQYIAKAGRPDAVTAMLEHGAQVNLRDTEGWTALHAVCMNDVEDYGNGGPSARDRIETARILIQAGAEIEAVSYLGLTPLLSLCSKPNPKLLEFMIVDQGANVDHRAKNGWTALFLIERQKEHERFLPKSMYPKCVELIKQNGGFKNREKRMIKFLNLVEKVLVPVNNSFLEQPWRVLFSPRAEQEVGNLKALLKYVEMDPELLTGKAVNWSCRTNNNENGHNSRTNWFMEFHHRVNKLIPSAFLKLYCLEAPTKGEWGVVMAANSKMLFDFEKKSNGTRSFDNSGAKDLLLQPFRNRGNRIGGIMEAYYKTVIDPMQHCV